MLLLSYVVIVAAVVVAIAPTVATAAMTLNDAGQNPHTLVTIRMTFQCNGPTLSASLSLPLCPSLTRIVTKNKLCGKAHAEGQNTLPVALNVCGTCNCRVRKFKCKGCHCTRTTNREQLMILVPHWRWPTLKAKSGCVCAKCMVKAQTRHLFIVNVLSALRALLWRLKRHLTEL